MTVGTRNDSAAHATPAMPSADQRRGAAWAVRNGVVTMLKTVEAVAAVIALATISFAKAARGAPHKRKPSGTRDEIG